MNLDARAPRQRQVMPGQHSDLRGIDVTLPSHTRAPSSRTVRAAALLYAGSVPFDLFLLPGLGRTLPSVMGAIFLATWVADKALKRDVVAIPSSLLLLPYLLVCWSLDNVDWG